MKNSNSLTDAETRSRHLRITEPSAWVKRFAPLIPENGAVLDLAAGGGRHSHHLQRLGHAVTAIDRDISGLGSDDGAEVIEADLEAEPAPFADGGALHGRTFGGICVINYLHRPLFRHIVAALEPADVPVAKPARKRAAKTTTGAKPAPAGGEEPKAKPIDDEVVKLLIDAYDAVKRDERGFAALGSVGQLAGNRSSFDTRNYGYKRLSDLIRVVPNFIVELREGGQTWIKRGH